MTGGNLVTNGIQMDIDANSAARINLDGGILDVTSGWAGTAAGGYTNGVITVSATSVIAIGDGVFQWKGTNKRPAIGALVASGYITFANPTTSGNYPTVTPEESWTSAGGATTLYADTNEIRSGYTTVWAESNDTDGDGYNNSIDVFPDDPDEWADADGDNVGDNADVHDGYNDAALDAYLSANGYSTGGLNEQDLIDLRVGSKLASIANDQATLQVVIEQSDNLGSWSTVKTEDVTVDAPAGMDKQFFRYRMQD